MIFLAVFVVTQGKDYVLCCLLYKVIENKSILHKLRYQICLTIGHVNSYVKKLLLKNEIRSFNKKNITFKLYDIFKVVPVIHHKLYTFYQMHIRTLKTHQIQILTISDQ